MANSLSFSSLPIFSSSSVLSHVTFPSPVISLFTRTLTLSPLPPLILLLITCLFPSLQHRSLPLSMLSFILTCAYSLSLPLPLSFPVLLPPSLPSQTLISQPLPRAPCVFLPLDVFPGNLTLRQVIHSLTPRSYFPSGLEQLRGEASTATNPHQPQAFLP